MKLKKFNESISKEDISNIVEEAFLNIKDKYPLDVRFNIEFFNKSKLYASSNDDLEYVGIDMWIDYDNQYNINNIDKAIERSTIFQDLIDESKVSVFYLKEHFNLSSLKFITNSADEGLENELGISLSLKYIK